MLNKICCIKNQIKPLPIKKDSFGKIKFLKIHIHSKNQLLCHWK